MRETLLQTCNRNDLVHQNYASITSPRIRHSYK